MEAIYDYNPDGDYVAEVSAIYDEIVDYLGFSKYGGCVVRTKKRVYIHK